MNKFVSIVICLMLFFSLTACGQEVSDLNGNQAAAQSGQSESSVPVQTEPQSDLSTQNVETAEDDEFNVEDESAKPQDLSKYEEVKKKNYSTDPVPEGKQEPVEPEDAEIDRNNQKTCYLSISCATILNNMDDLAEGKDVLVPADGVILPRTEVVFYAGESVFNILQRETQNRGIHMESSFMPIYNSAYIEGIGNLYEFDCGSESGWEYSVNGWFPNYGVSRYAVQQGDEIKLLYTCDLGRDLGADWMA